MSDPNDNDKSEWAKYPGVPKTVLDVEYLLPVDSDQAEAILRICEALPPIESRIAFNDMARALLGLDTQVEPPYLFPRLTAETQKQFMFHQAFQKMGSLPIYEHDGRILVKDTDEFPVIASSNFPNDLFRYALSWLVTEYGPFWANPVMNIQGGTIIFKHPGAPNSIGLRMIPVLGTIT